MGGRRKRKRKEIREIVQTTSSWKRFVYSLLSTPSLTSRAELLAMLSIDSARHSISLRRIRHPSKIHRVRFSIRTTRFEMGGRDFFDHFDRVPVCSVSGGEVGEWSRFWGRASRDEGTTERCTENRGVDGHEKLYILSTGECSYSCSVHEARALSRKKNSDRISETYSNSHLYESLTYLTSSLDCDKVDNSRHLKLL